MATDTAAPQQVAVLVVLVGEISAPILLLVAWASCSCGLASVVLPLADLVVGQPGARAFAPCTADVADEAVGAFEADVAAVAAAHGAPVPL